MNDLFASGPRGWADFSECGRYRHTLGRRVGTGNRILTWIMLNPSKAGAEENDPTITAVEDFTYRLGFDVSWVVNMYDWCATYPSELSKVPAPNSAVNDRAILRAVTDSHVTIAAWGAHVFARERVREVCSRLPADVQLYCLRRNKDGSPKHPLYIKRTTPLQVWNP